MAKILLVEDDRDLSATISKWLQYERHTIEVVHDGTEGLDRVLLGSYDVIILDWRLPELSGLEICKQYRDKKGNTPIIMLTGKTELTDKEAGLDAGADDYLTKPFSMRELTARLRALLRRSSSFRSPILKIGKLSLDPVHHQITKDGEPLNLAPIDFALLEFFMRHPNELLGTDALLQRVWHSDSEATSDSLRTSLKRIRKKIDDDPENSMIENIPRVGYRLKADQ